MALLAHGAAVLALIQRARTPPAAASPGPAVAAINFFVLPRTTPAPVDVAPAPAVPAAALAALRRITVELPPVALTGATLAPPILPTPGVSALEPASGAAAAAALTAPGAGPGTGLGTGSGTGDGSGYIFHAAPRTAILPPLARVPGSVSGRTLRVTFWVATDGRVTRVEVDPPIADAAYNREFQRRMLAYQFYPAHTRGGQNVDDVVTVPLRIGN